MAGNLDRRLSQLEDKAGGRGRMWYVIDMAGVSRDYSGDRALAELGIEATKNEVRKGLKDLDDYLQFLQLIHTQVHEWVSTDVTVKGNEVAALIEKHQALLGLGSAQGGQQ